MPIVFLGDQFAGSYKVSCFLIPEADTYMVMSTLK